MPQRFHSRRAVGRFVTAVALASPLAFHEQVHAVVRTWLVGSGNFAAPANWSGGVVPTGADEALISNTDATVRTITIGSPVSFQILTLNNSGSGSNSISQVAGEVDVSAIEQIGVSGKGIYSQTTGINSITATGAVSGLLLGVNNGGAGTYNLSGDGQLTVTANGAGGAEFIGAAGAGTFLQTGGINSLTGSASLSVGSASTGTGFYQLTSGAISANSGEIIGNRGNGKFLQLGGTNTILGNANLVLGNLSTGVGSYELHAGGTLTSGGAEFVGSSGVGTFTQLGGMNNANTGLTVGLSPGGNGAYSMSGGTLQVNGNTLFPMVVAALGTGTFTQSAGNVAVGSDSGTLDLIVASGGGTGTYNMMGTGILAISNRLSIGSMGEGTFNQTGGTVNAIGVTLGGGTLGSGTYLLASGSAALNVGSSGIAVNSGGTFLHSSGLVTTGQTIANSTSTLLGVDLEGGYYRLSGGTLEEFGGSGVGNGSFEQLGGLHLTHGIVILGSETGVTGTYLLSNGTFVQNTILRINDDLTFSQFGEFLILQGGNLVGAVNGFLNASDLHLAGGNVSGVLRNQGNFSYESGSFTAQLQNDGTFKLNGNTINIASTTTNNTLGTFNGPGTVTGAMNNSGVVNANGTLTTGTFNNFGLLNVGTNSALAPSSMVNSGQINLTRGVLNGAGSINNSGGVIAGGGTISMALTLNGGTVRADIPDSPMVISGALQINFPTSQLVIANNCTMILPNGVSNTANITLQGPGAKLTGNLPILNSGTVTGPGQISTAISNGGLVRISGGELLLTGTGNVNNSNGTFSIGSGGTITVTNGLANNVGTILLSNGAFDNSSASLNNVGTIAGRGSISSGTISNGGTIVFSGGSNDFLAPLTNSNRTTLTGNSLTTFYSPVDTTTGTLAVNLGSTAVFLGPVTGLGHIAGAGVKDFEGGASAGPIATLTGTTVVGVDGNLTAASVRDNTLNVVGRAVVLPNGTSTGTSRVNNLIIDGTTNNWSGRLNLSDNDLIVDYSGTSPLVTIADQIKAGFANGTWTGPGISSSAAALASGSLHKTALGYAEASTLNLTLFSGDSVDKSSVLVRYTWSGDANLDGIVNALDFNALATNFGAPGTRFWSDADFNYDNAVNTLDFNALASNFNQPAFASPPLGTLIPEPAAALAVTAAFLVRRRRG